MSRAELSQTTVCEDDLEGLIVANEDFASLEASIGVFCPFEAIGMVRQEIRHAHFLTYYLDAQRPHGFGSEVLRAVMRAAADAQRLSSPAAPKISAIDVHLMDLESAELRREWRRIDMLAIVHEEKLIVAIELKIDASEGDDQLAKYREVVRQRWPDWRHLFIFLTKRGDEASEDHGADWVALPLEAVARQLDGILKRQIGTADARNLLAAYVAMLRRHHLTNEKLEGLAARIWSQHREALEFLIEHRPEAGEGPFGELYDKREELACRMSTASGLEVVPDACSQSMLRFAVKDWDRLESFCTAQQWTPSNRLMLLEIERSGDRQSLRLRFALGRAPQETRLRYFQALVDEGVPTTKKKMISPQWTRLSTHSFFIGDDSSEDVLEYESILAKIENYAREYIPRYDAAFSEFMKINEVRVLQQSTGGSAGGAS